MRSSSRFDSAKDTLNWASEALDELKAACIEALKEDNFREFMEYDSKTREGVLKIVRVTPLPQSIPRKATEALNNIRHSFDQSLYAACWTIGKKPKKPIYFPWADSAIDLDHRLGATGKRKGNTEICQEFWHVLRGFEPYGRSDSHPGGNDLIRELAKIANRKHTVRLTFSIKSGGIGFDRFVGPAATLFGGHWDPVKNEIIIATFKGVKPDYQYTVYTDITLNEAGPLNGVSIVEALSAFLAKAKIVLEGLERESCKISAAI